MVGMCVQLVWQRAFERQGPTGFNETQIFVNNVATAPSHVPRFGYLAPCVFSYSLNLIFHFQPQESELESEEEMREEITELIAIGAKNWGPEEVKTLQKLYLIYVYFIRWLPFWP